MIGFIVGCLVGGCVGFITAAVLATGSEEDDIMFADEEINGEDKT